MSVHTRPQRRSGVEMDLLLLRAAVLSRRVHPAPEQHEGRDGGVAGREAPDGSHGGGGKGGGVESASHSTKPPSRHRATDSECTSESAPPVTLIGGGKSSQQTVGSGCEEGGGGRRRPLHSFLDYHERLRETERAWRDWAQAPLMMEGASAASVRRRSGNPASPGGTGGEEGLRVRPDGVRPPPPAALPFQVLRSPLNRPAAGDGRRGDTSVSAGRRSSDDNPYHLRLTMKSSRRSAPTLPQAPLGAAVRLQGSAASYATAADPLLSLSDELGVRHEARHRRHRQRLRELLPSAWWWQCTMPSFAAADATPQLMDTDVEYSFSRVARGVQDSGAVVV